MSQTTSANGLNYQITMQLGDYLQLYLELSTCDAITQDTC